MLRILFYLAVGLFFSGCAVTPQKIYTPEQLQQWAQHQQMLANWHNWQINGRIGVRKSGDQWSANVYWKQQAQAYELRFTAPLGQGVMRLAGDDAQVVLYTDEKPPLVANNPDDLLLKAIKIPLPVSGLHYWIRGIPSPKAEIETFELNEGYLKQLKQSGWTIDYETYQIVKNMRVPRKIYLENQDIEVRIIISTWSS